MAAPSSGVQGRSVGGVARSGIIKPSHFGSSRTTCSPSDSYVVRGDRRDHQMVRHQRRPRTRSHRLSA
jgi:hypothetical protein